MFKRFGETYTEPAVSRHGSDLAQRRRLLRCRNCGAIVSDESERIEMDGAHEHVRSNPYQYTYRIGCFRRAPGCVARGTPSAAHTWFAGHQWQVVVCGTCGTHLGWRFDNGGGGVFHALILTNLQSG